jgi:hypothetical protein
LGLLDRDNRVLVFRDAVLAPGEAHDDGIERMRAAGVTLIGAKGLFYEWVRTVDLFFQARAEVICDRSLQAPAQSVEG